MSSRNFDTILEFCGESDGRFCGYCKNSRHEMKEEGKEESSSTSNPSSAKERDNGGSVSIGLWAHALSNNDYLSLMDRGWRRSGKYLYKPTNEITCCPQYTIRLDSTKFVLSRSQKRTLRQMNEFLATGKKPRCSVKEESEVQAPVTKQEQGKPIEGDIKKKKLDRPVMKKKEIRRQRFEEKCKLKNLDIEELKRKRIEKEEDRRRTIESYIAEQKDDWKHKMEVKLVSTESEEFSERSDESYELYKRYQSTVHKDNEKAFASYRNFLCSSPLEHETDETGEVQLGSYHLWFILDGKLIAVSVVDVLPRCLSAKYMFYDTDYSFLSMGTYTALREIEQTRKYAAINPEIKYYYMGYYIESCAKMRYKAKFRPSDLLCDHSFEWLDFDAAHKLLLESKEPNGYAVFFPELPKPIPMNIDDFWVLAKRTVQPYSVYLNNNPQRRLDEAFNQKLERLAQVVGQNLPLAVYYFSALN